MKFIKKIILNIKNQKMRNKGESIIEVVTAVTILATILVSTFSILGRATQTNVNIRNRVIALNIAREGIEAVRNIRDTNWLKYSGDRRGLWLCLDSSVNPNACFPENISAYITDGSYTIDFDNSNQRYYLTLDSSAPEDEPINNTNAKLYKTTGTPIRYTHVSTSNNSTIFYRQLELKILNPYNTSPLFCINSNDCNEARLNIISRVQWEEGGALRTSTLQTYLFDFFERNEY